MISVIPKMLWPWIILIQNLGAQVHGTMQNRMENLDSHDKIFEATGVKYYNLKMEYNMFGQNLKVYGVLNDEGTKLCFKGKIQKFNYNKNRGNFVCSILKLYMYHKGCFIVIIVKHFLGFTGTIDIMKWMDEEAIKKLKEEREPVESPTSHYNPKPEEMGKLLWFSGKVL